MNKLTLGPDGVLPITDFRKSDIVVLMTYFDDNTIKYYILKYDNPLYGFWRVSLYGCKIHFHGSPSFYEHTSPQFSVQKCLSAFHNRRIDPKDYTVMKFDSLQEFQASLYWLPNNNQINE